MRWEEISDLVAICAAFEYRRYAQVAMLRAQESCAKETAAHAPAHEAAQTAVQPASAPALPPRRASSPPPVPPRSPVAAVESLETTPQDTVRERALLCTAEEALAACETRCDLGRRALQQAERASCDERRCASLERDATLGRLAQALADCEEATAARDRAEERRQHCEQTHAAELCALRAQLASLLQEKKKPRPPPPPPRRRVSHEEDAELSEATRALAAELSEAKQALCALQTARLRDSDTARALAAQHARELCDCDARARRADSVHRASETTNSSPALPKFGSDLEKTLLCFWVRPW